MMVGYEIYFLLLSHQFAEIMRVVVRIVRNSVCFAYKGSFAIRKKKKGCSIVHTRLSNIFYVIFYGLRMR